MKTRRPKELAAVHALGQQRPKLDDVKSLKVDGQEVDLEKVEKRLDQVQNMQDTLLARAEKSDLNPGFVERGFEKIDKKSDRFREKIGNSKYGDRMLDSISVTTEQVHRSHDVTIELKNGSELHIPLEFIDLGATDTLYKLNKVGLLSGSVPWLGHFFPPLFAVSTLLAGQIARLVDDEPLRNALIDTGKKQARQAGVAAIPLVSSPFIALTILKSHDEARTLLFDAAKARDVANLSGQSPAVVPKNDDNALLAFVANEVASPKDVNRKA
ncbi:MAG: hypothetical protein GY822_15620 [Deltaproteobacteria bacterium]|nr:hypothetical protein [Deltaproteobacteria bacterium]